MHAKILTTVVYSQARVNKARVSMRFVDESHWPGVIEW